MARFVRLDAGTGTLYCNIFAPALTVYKGFRGSGIEFFGVSTSVVFCLNQGVMAKVQCPNCGKTVEYQGNEFRPFCSERCKLLDLGAWADEEYTLPVEETDFTEEDLAQIENAVSRKVEE